MGSEHPPLRSLEESAGLWFWQRVSGVPSPAPISSDNPHPVPLSIVVGRFGWGLIVDEVLSIKARGNLLEATRALCEMEKVRQIAGGASIGEGERSLRYIEDSFDEPERATEIEPLVVHVGGWRIGGNNDKRNPKAVLIIAQWSRQDGRRFMVIPAAPVVPCNQNRSIGPIPRAAIASGGRPDGIDDRGHPRRASSWPTFGTARVIGVGKDGSDPAHIGQFAGLDVGQHVSRVQIHIRSPFGAGALCVGRVGL